MSAREECGLLLEAETPVAVVTGFFLQRVFTSIFGHVT
jgi:hypothetical protein